MTRRAIETTAAPTAVGPYSQAITTDGLVFCSGQLGLDPMPHLSRGRTAQPFYLVTELDEVLIQMAGTAEIEFRELENSPSTIMRMQSAQRCQPLAANPPRIEALAASGSRCCGCGSNSEANSMISSALIRCSPSEKICPERKSSK